MKGGRDPVGHGGFGSCAREAMRTIGAPKGRPPTRSILKTRARRREPPWTLGDFRQRPALDDMTGISRPSRPPERPIIAIHETFSGLAEIARKRLSQGACYRLDSPRSLSACSARRALGRLARRQQGRNRCEVKADVQRAGHFHRVQLRYTEQIRSRPAARCACRSSPTGGMARYVRSPRCATASGPRRRQRRSR